MTDQSVAREPAAGSGNTGGSADGRALHRRATSLPWLARAAGVGLSGLSVGFVLLFLFVLQSGGELSLLTRPLPMRIALVLPYPIAILALGTVVGAALAWRHRYWSSYARIHQTILAVLGVGFTWQLAELGLLAV